MKELKKHKKSLLVRKAAHFTMYAVIGGSEEQLRRARELYKQV